MYACMFGHVFFYARMHRLCVRALFRVDVQSGD